MKTVSYSRPTSQSYCRFSALLLLFLMSPIYGQDVEVALYYHRPLEQVIFTATSGSYEIRVSDSVCTTLHSGATAYLSAVDSLAVLYLPGQKTFQSNSFMLIPVPADTGSSRFRLQAITPALPANEYPGSLILKAGHGILLPVNRVETETYVAAVTEAEGGGLAPAAFVQAQAILVRTFLSGADERHPGEGFDLCDGVHCQAYHGTGKYHNRIAEISGTTAGRILTGENGMPLLIAYHANSGGETADSRDVWLVALPWLKTIEDPYSLKGSHAHWQHVFTLTAWRRILTDLGMAAAEKIPDRELDFQQKHRNSTYLPSRGGVPFRMIREKLDLPSAFFSVKVKDNKVFLDGRGYGHGLGLSQEGAMEMARQGFSADEILKFYFPGVVIRK